MRDRDAHTDASGTTVSDDPAVITVLFLDDEQLALNSTRRALRPHGIAVEGYPNVAAFHSAADRQPGTVAMVDWNLRTSVGTDVIVDRRTRGDARRIALTSGALDVEYASKVAKQAGADRFIEKNQTAGALAKELRELAEMPPRTPSGTFRLDPRTHATAIEVRDGRIILHEHELTARSMEYRVLEFLLQHPNREATFNELLEHLWNEPVRTRSPAQDRLLRGRVTTTIRRLRKALGSASSIVKSVADGYRIQLSPSQP